MSGAETTENNLSAVVIWIWPFNSIGSQRTPETFEFCWTSMWIVPVEQVKLDFFIRVTLDQGYIMLGV